MTLVAPGTSVDLPAGWQIRSRRQSPSVPGRPGNLLVHLATVALPQDRGDFGSGVALGPDDVFVALFEYDPEAAAEPLFAAAGLPRLRPSEFSPDALQQVARGRSGGQWFFSQARRAFCLHVVLGSHARRAPGAVRVNRLLAGISIGRTP